ncbi:hypothetical protein LCGC14_1814710 [marine sediment metagenome]|uniref:Uncharacterized protein n=1 Tax=marine sediment metagenome TaxID=412755 RepID=A0A0F9J0H7_9ZZZZ
MNEWIATLKETRKDFPAYTYRYAKLCEIIEFLQQAKTNEMLSVTAQMRIADPNPVRRLDLMQRDLEGFSARISRVENSVIVQRQCIAGINIKDLNEYIGPTIEKLQEEVGTAHRRITDFKGQLEALRAENRYQGKRINALEQKEAT